MVIPLHKKGSKQMMSNYRPISLLPTTSKILEKIVKARLASYTEETISKNQYGFRVGTGTNDALAALTQIINENYESKNKSLAVFVDLAKAFDTVSHKILLKKLELLGIAGAAYQWFSSYLGDRSQLVRVGSHLSATRSVEFGVPQGSVLGPILFNIYLNDFCSLLDTCKTLCFADDTVLIFAEKTWKDTFKLAREGIKQAKTWFDGNLLTLNDDKTLYMCFSPTGAGLPDENLALKLHTCQVDNSCQCKYLQRTSHTTYLGVTLDEHLKWDKHVFSISAKIIRLGYVYRELRNILSETLLWRVYLALTQSLMLYGVICWGSCGSTVMDKLIIAHKQNLKIIKRKPIIFPTIEIFKICKVLSPRKIFIWQTAVYMSKHILDFTLQIYNRPSRKEMRRKYQAPFKTTVFGRRNFSAIAPRLYHLLPNTISNYIDSDTEPFSMRKSKLNKKIKEYLFELSEDKIEDLWHKLLN